MDGAQMGGRLSAALHGICVRTTRAVHHLGPLV